MKISKSTLLYFKSFKSYQHLALTHAQSRQTVNQCSYTVMPVGRGERLFLMK